MEGPSQSSIRDKTHEGFPETSGTDLVVRSSDGVLFNLHRKYLEATTGSFPGPEFDTQGEVIQLSEPADVLALLFHFVVPERQPHLRGVKFPLLEVLAEAANKYQVFSAMNICEARLMENIASYPRPILVHGIKHDYPALVSKASLCLARVPLLKVIDYLPVHALTAWIEYHETWKRIFKDVIKSCIKDNTQICESCKGSMILWVMELEATESLPVLNLKVTGQMPTVGKPRACVNPGAHYYPGQNTMAGMLRSKQPNETMIKCKQPNEAMILTCKTLQDRIGAVPPFKQFMRGKRQRDV